MGDSKDEIISINIHVLIGLCYVFPAITISSFLDEEEKHRIIGIDVYWLTGGLGIHYKLKRRKSK